MTLLDRLKNLNFTVLLWNMTLNIIIIIYLLFLPFITTSKSLILGDSPGFSSTSISSCTLASAILDTSLLLKLQIKNLTLPSCSASKTTFRKALFTNKCKFYKKKLWKYAPSIETKWHHFLFLFQLKLLFANHRCFKLKI